MTVASVLFLALFGALGWLSRPLLALGIAMAGVAVLLLGTSQQPGDLIGRGGISPILMAAVFWMMAALLAYLMGYLVGWWRARV